MRAAALLVALALCAAAKPFTAHDLHAIRRVGAPVSDGSSRYITTLTVWDEATNKKTQNLWLGAVKPNSVPVAISPLEHVIDYSQVWAPKGKAVLFLSTRDGKNGLWAASPDKPSAAAYLVAEFPVGVDNLKLSPRGTYAALTAQVYPGLDMAATAARDAEEAQRHYSAQVFNSLFIRRWDDWWTGKFNHIFVLKLSHDALADRWSADASSAFDVMPTVVGDCPSRPTGSADEFSWSADEKEIAYTTQVGRDMAWSTDLNVYTVQVADVGATKCLTCSNKATDTSPAHSPDGTKLAYLAMSTPAYEADLKRVVVVERATGASRTLTTNWDRGVDHIQWSADSKTLLATALDDARERVFSIDVATGQRATLIADNANEAVDWIACHDAPKQRCLVFSRSSQAHPSEVFATKADGSAYRLTDFNADILAKVELTEVKEYLYTGAGGDKIQGWITMPRGFDESRTYPLVLYIHGGPESAWLDNWGYRWNSHTIAARGYAVFAPNIHGSSSFGSNFTRAVLRDWGGKPFEDVMDGLSSVLRDHPWMDASRVAAMGASFGGFMINWLNGHTEKVFKCLVFHDGIFDAKDFFYTTDELFFAENEFGGPAYDPAAEETYKKNSPSTFAHKFSTPELVIHGGKDYRIVDSTGISTFTLLQRKGVPSRMVYFPRSAHTITEPNDSIFWHDQVITWLGEWLD